MNSVTTVEMKKDTATPAKKVEKIAEGMIEAQKKPSPKRKPKPRSMAPGTQKGTPVAKKTAAVVLEVLAGVRSPTDAAEALGVSPTRYYILESRALQGLVDALEPRPAGPPVQPEKQLARLTREVDNLRHEVARYQALARAAQRTLGVTPARTEKRSKRKGGKRRKKPTVRALKAAAGFRKSDATEKPDAPVVNQVAESTQS